LISWKAGTTFLKLLESFHNHVCAYLLLLMKKTASLAAKMRALALMAVSTACNSPSGPSSSTGLPCDGVDAVKPAAAAGGVM
jgi:hypothetical protein